MAQAITRTQKLADALDAIYESRTDIQEQIASLSRTGPKGGHNARNIDGWHPSPSGTVSKAANLSKHIPTMNYWAGSASTPSTAIPHCMFHTAASAEKEIFG